MKDIKSYFSLAFYRETLLRMRTYALVVAIVFTALGALGSVTYLFAQISAAISGTKITLLTSLTLSDINGSAGTLVGIITPILTVNAFSFLMKRNEADFYGTVPVKRSAMAVSGMLAVFTVVLFTLAVSSLFSVLVLIPCMGVSVKFFFGKSVVEFFGYVLASLLAIAAATVAVSVTGTQRNAIVTAGIIIFVPRAVMGLINLSVEMLNPELVSGQVIRFFNGNLNFLTSIFTNSFNPMSSVMGTDTSPFGNPWGFAYTAVLFLLYAFVGVLLFVRRRSEAATHAFENKVARHAMRIAVSTLVATLGIFVLCIDFELVFGALFLFAASVGVYFVYELATGKKEKTFLSALFTLPIFVGVCGAIAAFVIVANLALGAYSPSADEIESVSIISESGNAMYLDYGDYVTLRSEKSKLDDEDTKYIVASAFGRDVSASSARDYQQVVFKIKTKGGTAYRRLNITGEEMWTISARLAEDETYEELWLSVGEGAVTASLGLNGVNLDEEAAMRVLAAAQAEIERIGFESWYEIYNNGESYATLYYTVYYNGGQYEIVLPLYEELAETAQVCERERALAADAAIQSIKERLDDALAGKAEGVWLNISYFGKEYQYEIDMPVEENDAEAAGLVSELLPLVSNASFDYDGLYLSIFLYDEELFSESIYVDLAVAEGVTEQRIIEFLEKYGIKY